LSPPSPKAPRLSWCWLNALNHAREVERYSFVIEQSAMDEARIQQEAPNKPVIAGDPGSPTYSQPCTFECYIRRPCVCTNNYCVTLSLVHKYHMKEPPRPPSNMRQSNPQSLASAGSVSCTQLPARFVTVRVKPTEMTHHCCCCCCSGA
jgi:hypothetical protein